jgi:hypothetical protein
VRSEQSSGAGLIEDRSRDLHPALNFHLLAVSVYEVGGVTNIPAMRIQLGRGF